MTFTTPNAHALSVLVIDDNPDFADSLALFFRLGLGYRVATAADGLRGVRMALAEPPDVVLCDIGLPGENGLIAGRELIDRLPRRPLLIAVTGYADARIRRLAAAAGFDHYLVKPADPFEIEALIAAFARDRPAEGPCAYSARGTPATDWQ